MEPFFAAMTDSSLRAILVASVVALVLFVSRVESGSVRHAAWAAVTTAMLAMPALLSIVPTFEVALPIVRVKAPEIRALASIDSDRRSVTNVTERPSSGTPENLATGPRPVPQPDDRPASKPSGSMVLALGYFAGLLVMLARLLIGLLGMRKVWLSSCRTDLRAVYESPLVAVPLTIGVTSPRVVLPLGWRQWPEETLRAVLAHERTHILRRDPLVAALAHVNRCIFWFHPLAWWLERTLAATSEHACDEAAVRATGQSRRYAEILLDMAEAVRQRGRRVAWQGLGVDGNGLLGERIDRILRRGGAPEPSGTRKALVALGCVAGIAIVVGCRQQPQPAPLQPDRELADRQARQKAEAESRKTTRGMTHEQLASLEAVWKQNPEDLDALKKLLVYYGPDYDSQPPPNRDQIVAARRPLILWLIEHHPEHELAGYWQARIFTTGLDPLPDPAGYAEAKRLWLAQTARPGASVRVFANAATFFEVADKPLAEQMLLKAQARDPKGQWSAALGRLYAFTVMGSNASTPLNVLRYANPDDARGPYATEIRHKLSESTNIAVLMAAGQYLVRSGQFFAGGTLAIGFDPVALGRSCFERVLTLDSSSVPARAQLVSLQITERDIRRRSLLLDKEIEALGRPVERKDGRIDEKTQKQLRALESQVVAALPEAERFIFLPSLAQEAYMQGESAEYYQQDQAGARAARARARAYAEEALVLAPKYKASPDYGTAIYKANIALATLALRDGDRTSAVRYMRAAAAAPPSEELAYFFDSTLRTRLHSYLLKAGERDSVVESLEKLAQISVTQKDSLLASAAAIRRGQMPVWAQRTLTGQ